MNRPWAWLKGVALVSMTLAAAPAAWSDVEVIGPTVIASGSYTGDSSHGVTAFEDAIAGKTLTLIPFTMTSAGELIVLDESCQTCDEQTALSDHFSEEVLFRSPANTPVAYPEQIPAAHPDQVNLIGNLYADGSDEIIRTPDNYRIFPVPTLSDPLEIDFMISEEDVGVMAVGFGVYADISQTITVYPADGGEVTIYDHSGGDGFVFLGFVATTPKDAIGRIEIHGAETVVLDVSFVPEPAAGVAATVALFAVLGLAKTHRRRS